MQAVMKSGRERRTERERIELIFTKGLYRTFAEVSILGVLVGVAFIVMAMGLIYGW